MLRLVFAFSALVSAAPLSAQPEYPPENLPENLGVEPRFVGRLQNMAQADAPLDAARVGLPECEDGCMVPAEAVALAYSLGDKNSQAGRFILDIRGGGRSMTGNLERLFFVNSMQEYAEFGTLTIAFEEEALQDLLDRPRGCPGGEIVDGSIEVRGCRQGRLVDLNMFTMMQRLSQKRIVVDGEVRLQWIDSRYGARRRKGSEKGYYQVWVRVDDADQVTIINAD